MGNIEVSNVTQHPTEDAAELDPFGLFPVDDLQGGSNATRRNACLVNAFGVAVTDAAPLLTDEVNVLGSELEGGAGKHRVIRDATRTPLNRYSCNGFCGELLSWTQLSHR